MKPLTAFATDRTKRDGRQWRCQSCSNLSVAATRAKDPEREKRRQRAARLKFEYGISIEAYDAMLHDQRSVCAVCGGVNRHSLAKTQAPPRLAVDHCHEVGVVRGLLCFKCNTDLGTFEKVARDPRFLDYLERAGTLYTRPTLVSSTQEKESA